MNAPSVMPIPATGANPYLALLYQHLSAQGIEVFSDEHYVSRRLLGLPGAAPDFVHYHWPENKYGHHSKLRLADRAAWFFAQLELKKRAGAKIVWTLHNAVPHESAGEAFHRWAKAKMLDMTDLVLVNFEAARDFLAREYGRTRDVHVVPHGSYRGFYPDAVSRAEAQRALGIPEGCFVFLVFGDLRAYKNIELVMRAFARISDQRVRLLVAGAPRHLDYGRALQKLAARDPRVLLHMRRVPDAEVQHIFRASDVLLLGQETFSSGSAILGLDFDLPLIGRRTNHVAELAQGAALLEVAVLNEPDLLQAMERAIHMDLSQAREDARRSSRALAWPSIAARLAEILRAAR